MGLLRNPNISSIGIKELMASALASSAVTTVCGVKTDQTEFDGSKLSSAADVHLLTVDVTLGRTAMHSMNLLGNAYLSEEPLAQLVAAATESSKITSLCGMKTDQTEFDG